MKDLEKTIKSEFGFLNFPFDFLPDYSFISPYELSLDASLDADMGFSSGLEGLKDFSFDLNYDVDLPEVQYSPLQLGDGFAEDYIKDNFGNFDFSFDNDFVSESETDFFKPQSLEFSPDAWAIGPDNSVSADFNISPEELNLINSFENTPLIADDFNLQSPSIDFVENPLVAFDNFQEHSFYEQSPFFSNVVEQNALMDYPEFFVSDNIMPESAESITEGFAYEPVNNDYFFKDSSQAGIFSLFDSFGLDSVLDGLNNNSLELEKINDLIDLACVNNDGILLETFQDAGLIDIAEDNVYKNFIVDTSEFFPVSKINFKLGPSGSSENFDISHEFSRLQNEFAGDKMFETYLKTLFGHEFYLDNDSIDSEVGRQLVNFFDFQKRTGVKINLLDPGLIGREEFKAEQFKKPLKTLLERFNDPVFLKNFENILKISNGEIKEIYFIKKTFDSDKNLVWPAGGSKEMMYTFSVPSHGVVILDYDWFVDPVKGLSTLYEHLPHEITHVQDTDLSSENLLENAFEYFKVEDEFKDTFERKFHYAINELKEVRAETKPLFLLRDLDSKLGTSYETKLRNVIDFGSELRLDIGSIKELFNIKKESNDVFLISGLSKIRLKYELAAPRHLEKIDNTVKQGFSDLGLTKAESEQFFESYLALTRLFKIYTSPSYLFTTRLNDDELFRFYTFLNWAEQGVLKNDWIV